MKVKTETITFSIWCIVLISRILISLNNGLISSPLGLYYGSAIILITWMIFLKIKNRNRRFIQISPLLLWGVSFGVYLLLFGKIFANDSLKSLTSFTFNAMLVFYILVFFMAAYIDDEHKKTTFIKVSFWTFSLSVMLSSVLNWDGNSQISGLISNVFKGYTRDRSAFGFHHPNTVANIALCIILLSAYLIRNDKKRWRYIFVDAFMIYVILSAASRTALSALMFFIVLIIYDNLLKKIKGKNERIIFGVMLFAIVILLILFSSKDGLDGLFKVSNRQYNFTYNIPILNNNGRLMIGLGLIGSGEFYQLPQYHTFFVDNYFLYVLMSTGIIGLLFIITFMVYLGRKLFAGSEDVPMKRLTLIVFFVNVFSSLGETCFMYPSFASCFIYTTLYIAYACNKEDVELGLRKYEYSM